jgi:Uncharacterized conserved protein
MTHPVLTERLGPAAGAGLWITRAALVTFGVAALTVAAKVSIPAPPSPVPVNLRTLRVLAVGLTYGLQISLATIVASLALGAAGVGVYAAAVSVLAEYQAPP